MRERSSIPTVVMARGEIDLDTAPSLERALADALRAYREVVLDLTYVTFMDCAGLNVLVAARRQADLHGRRFAVHGAGCAVARLLEITGMDQHLTVVPEVFAPTPGAEGEPR